MIQSIMKGVTTVLFSIHINNNISNRFRPARGIKQGYPFSLYIFIIYVEVLSNLINDCQNKGSIHGLAIAKNYPYITFILWL